MGFDRRGSQDFDYKDFKLRLGTAGFNTTQTSSLNMRLSLLEGFLDGILEETGVPFYEEPMPVFHATIDGMRRKQRWKDEQRSKRLNQPDIWSSKPRSLTIVDLSDPLVSDGNSACALFNMCLDLFLQHHPDGGTILALDEAHKVRWCRPGQSVPLIDHSICQRRALPRILQTISRTPYAFSDIRAQGLSLQRRSRLSPPGCWIYAR